MKDIFKEIIIKYPGYVAVLLDLDSDTIKLLHSMEDSEVKELLNKLASKKEDKKEKQEKVFYYTNY